MPQLYDNQAPLLDVLLSNRVFVDTMLRSVGRMDEVEWNRFVETYYRQIYAFCVQYLGNPSEAEDAVQEVFMRAFKKRSQLKKGESERAWLYSITRNYCADWKRALVRRLRLTTDLAVRSKDQESTATSTSCEYIVRETVYKALGHLPRRQAEVFILRHWHGFSTEETADLLGIQSGSVKSHLKRAIDSMKLKMFSDVAEDEFQEMEKEQ